MNIAFDAKRAFLNKTGLGNYSRMIIKGLSDCDENHNLFLCTPDTNDIYRQLFADNQNVIIIEPNRKSRLYSSVWRTNNPISSIKNTNIDIFHGLSQELPLNMPKNVKTVVTVHDLIAWRYPQYFSFFDRKIYKKKIEHACKKADIIIAISRQTSEDLQQILGIPEEKIRIIYQDCDDIFYNEISENQKENARIKYSLPERYILNVATIEPRKNQISVVKAMKLLPNDIDLVLVSKSTKNLPMLRNVIKEENLESRIKILHNVDFADLPALYANAEMSAYMSYFEGFGIPVLESLRCGTPVVTSNISSMPEAGGDAALYADPTNYYDIAEKCNFILKNNKFKDEFTQKAIVHCKNFDTKSVISQLNNLYKELCK